MLLHSVFTFLVGLAIGSFLNVCIFRLPKRISVVTPGSSCPACGHHLNWKENIPVVSYLLQRAHCRHCQGRIHWIYPVVEVSTACLFTGLFLRFGISPPFFLNALFFSALIVLMVIDVNERILPNPLTMGGTVAGLALAPARAITWLPICFRLRDLCSAVARCGWWPSFTIGFAKRRAWVLGTSR